MRRRGERSVAALVALGLAALVWCLWPARAGHHLDDGGIYERYLLEASAGRWSSYNADQGAVFGMSGFLFGLLGCALARLGVAPAVALDALNLLGTALVYGALFALCRCAGGAGRRWSWALAVLAVVASPALATNLRQALEVPLHCGLVLAGVALGAGGGSPRLLLAVAATLVWSKLDALPVSVVLAALGAHEVRAREGWRGAIATVALWYALPLLVYVVATSAVFGSPLPHSASVKLVLYRRHGGAPGIFALWLRDPSRWALVAAAVCGGAHDGWRAWRAARASGEGQRLDAAAVALRAALPLVAALSVALVYAVYSPAEVLPWYPALGEVLLAAQVAVSVARWLARSGGRWTSAASVALLAGGALMMPLAGAFRAMTDAVDAYGEVPRLAAVARRTAGPHDTAATCMGLFAREWWPRAVIDTCGINDPRAAEILRAGLDPVDVLQPEWVLEVGRGRAGYELVTSSYEHTRLGWRGWRLLRRRGGARPHRELLAGDVLEGHARRVAHAELPPFAGSLWVEGTRVRLRLQRPGGPPPSRFGFGIERQPAAAVLQVTAPGCASWSLHVAATTRAERMAAVDLRVCGGGELLTVAWESGDAVRLVDPFVVAAPE